MRNISSHRYFSDSAAPLTIGGLGQILLDKGDKNVDSGDLEEIPFQFKQNLSRI